MLQNFLFGTKNNQHETDEGFDTPNLLVLQSGTDAEELFQSYVADGCFADIADADAADAAHADE